MSQHTLIKPKYKSVFIENLLSNRPFRLLYQLTIKRAKFFCFCRHLAFIFAFIWGLEVAHAEPGVTTNKSLSFSGYVWRVKASEKRVGPGANYFSDSGTNVWVDDAGRLHLRISNDDGKWRCGEVISETSFGFGTYRFYM